MINGALMPSGEEVVMDADRNKATFEQAYHEILETARRQVSSYSLAQPAIAEGGGCDWWEYSPHRSVTSGGSSPVIIDA